MSRSRGCNPLLLLSFAASLSIVAVPCVSAAERDKHFIIPAGSLSGALLALSQQSGQPIVFNPKDVESFSANASDSPRGVEQILHDLLDPNGLEFFHDPSGAFVIRVQERRMKSTNVSTLPEMVVLGDRTDVGGLASTTTETTRTGTPLRLTPQSITVINSEIMEAQGARDVSDALKNVAGVTVLPSSLGSASVSVRGYQSSVLSEGMTTTSGSTPLSVPAIALQSVETLKGPSAILSGAGSPGGTINLVYKKPQQENAHEVRLGVGSYNERELGIDSTGAVAGNQNLSYRLIVNDRVSDYNAAGYDGAKDYYLSPSFRWQDDDTDVNFRYTKIQRTTPFQPYTVMHDGRPWTGYFPKPLGNKNDSLHLDQDEYNLSLDQVLGEHWKYVAKGTYTTAKFAQYGWYTGSTLDDEGTVYMNHFAQAGTSHQLNLDNYVRGTYQWGELSSTTVLGFGATRTRAINNSQAVFGDWETVNIFGPAPDFPSAKSTYLKSFSESIPVGGYWQQQFSYGKWNLSAGLRYDTTWNGAFRRQEATDSQKEQVWSPSIGLAYEIAPWMTIYGSHLRGYQPPSYLDRNGNLLPAQVSKQNEGGFKFSFFDQRLSVTAAAYHVEFNNYAYYDMDQSAYVSTAGYVSRGFEVETQGSLTPHWDVVGSYNYGRTQFAADSDTHAGLPEHKASLWTRYQFNDGVLKGVSASVGLYYSGIAYLDKEKTNKLPTQLETDATLRYSIGAYSLDMVARNIFNEHLYVTSLDGDDTFVALQQPRTLQFSGTYHF